MDSVTPTLTLPQPSTYERIYAVVRNIPAGCVATYGQVAEVAGFPNQARLVGYALFRVDKTSDIPWHRVINHKGEISQSAFREGDDDLQRVLLVEEGIEFNSSGKVNLSRYRWHPRGSMGDPLNCNST